MIPTTSVHGRQWLARGSLLVACLAVLSACGAEPIATELSRPGASFSTDEIARTLSSRQLDAILSREGALPVTLDEFVARWNEQAEANPEVQLTVSAFEAAENGHVTHEFFEFLRLEGVVNDDGTLRSMALVDQTTFINPAEVFRSNRGDAHAFMPLRAAFARYFFGRAVDPGLSPEAQGRLIVDVIGTDDPEVLRTFGDQPVDVSKAVNGILYRFASDRRGNVWFIARPDDEESATTEG
jgi:hypothetical protein